MHVYRLLAFSFVLHIAASALAQSIPDPTDSSAMAVDADSQVLIVNEVSEIRSSEARALVTIVELGPDDRRQLGIRLLLENDSGSDEVYLDSTQATQFSNELAGLNTDYDSDGNCSGLCYHGIARCRPSQSVDQAYCPETYRTVDEERGLRLRTPRQSFRYPATRPTVFADAMSEAVGQLDDP